MDRVWAFFHCESTWPQNTQPAKTVSPERAASLAQPPSRTTQPGEPGQNCALPRQTASIVKPDFESTLTLWSGRLTSAFASRVLPPPPPASPTRGDFDTGLQYRNPAGQLVTRPDISKEEDSRPMSDIEWAVQNVVRRKYPEIHYEIVIAALEHAGHIQPGADPAFPNSVLATVPPESSHPEEQEQQP